MPTKPTYNLPPLDFINETIGKRISRLRKQKELTQKELADKIGIKRTLVAAYELDRIRMFDEMVTRFALALEVSTDEILGLKDFEAKEPKHSYSLKKELDKVRALTPEKQERIARIIKKGLEKLQSE